MVEDASDSLEGIRVTEPCEFVVTGRVREVRMCVSFIAAAVAELSKENVTVLKSRVDAPVLEMYTIDRVGLMASEVEEKLDVV